MMTFQVAQTQQLVADRQQALRHAAAIHRLRRRVADVVVRTSASATRRPAPPAVPAELAAELVAAGAADRELVGAAR